MSATIRDVATRAGVSVATASRALSGERGVRPENRERVMAAAAALAYQPNILAAALRGRTTYTVGMVVPSIANPYFATLVEAVEHQLRDDDRSLLLANSRYDAQTERRQIQALLDRRVDSLILVPCDRTLSCEATADAAARVPTVQVDLRVDAHAGSSVTVDNEFGLRLAVDHVVDRGATCPVFVGAEPVDSSAQERLDGYRQAIGRHGLTEPDVLLGDFSTDWGREAARRIVARAPRPDAVICGNDMIALGVLDGLAAAGVQVPDDIQVTGFDDTPYAALSRPSLTTVRQPQDEIAAQAVRLLDTAAARSDSPPPQRIAITPALVARGSTLS
ncbi:LacI family transcriptional regulator [Rhodococcus sp. OK519]|uniref:LacI family DNA-binding transcriptional regulator n=1 Tax=Rhodococcus sp. OK519 TaxID=2135729 RepID=UPI000D3B8D61|nr:LacI family transcriptional regulator [Rhodococcus sp. OK519]